MEHYFIENRLPRFLRKDTKQNYLDHHPISSLKETGHPYFVFDGFISFLIYQFSSNDERKELTLTLHVHSHGSIDVRKYFAARLLESRSLGNPQIVDGYKCPTETTINLLLKEEWPLISTSFIDDSLNADLKKSGFLKETDSNEPILLNILDELMASLND